MGERNSRQPGDRRLVSSVTDAWTSANPPFISHLLNQHKSFFSRFTYFSLHIYVCVCERACLLIRRRVLIHSDGHHPIWLQAYRGERDDHYTFSAVEDGLVNSTNNNQSAAVLINIKYIGDDIFTRAVGLQTKRWESHLTGWLLIVVYMVHVLITIPRLEIIHLKYLLLTTVIRLLTSLYRHSNMKNKSVIRICTTCGGVPHVRFSLPYRVATSLDLIARLPKSSSLSRIQIST